LFSFTIQNTTPGGTSVPKVSWLIEPGAVTGTIEPLDVAYVLNFGPGAPAGTYTLYAWIGDAGDTGEADSSEEVTVSACPGDPGEPGEPGQPEVGTGGGPAPQIPVTGGPVPLIPVTGLGSTNLYFAAQFANLGFGSLALGILLHGFVLIKREDED
jgi:hypothetical protein